MCPRAEGQPPAIYTGRGWVLSSQAETIPKVLRLAKTPCARGVIVQWRNLFDTKLVLKLLPERRAHNGNCCRTDLADCVLNNVILIYIILLNAPRNYQERIAKNCLD